ncbi:hypothetical protein G3H63_09405 [Microbacterium resistens]|uniref:hypothetical protein n=1 Tax=Microbacterium resistens TaxID=156977 RepID=UPI001C584648|nr:hypothetical protein [Microbacterium resistens]MBW1639286.1 hypothetical protein [Microbacterium resistens]
MNENAKKWAVWLQAELDRRGWRGADLVRESGETVKRDRVSKWLRGYEAPSHRLAVVVANTLGVDSTEALIAAGFNVVRLDEDGQIKLDPEKTLAAIRNMERSLPDEFRLRQLEHFSDAELLAELQRRAASATNVTQLNVRRPRQDDLRAVAHEYDSESDEGFDG